MILLKKWAKHKVKSYIYCVNQFLRKKHHEKWNQECKQKQSLLFNFCNIFYLLTPSTQKIAWRLLVFKPDYHIFSYNEQQVRKIWRNFIDKFLLYHTSLIYNIQTVKVGLSPSNFFFIYLNDSPSKIMKNAFYFILKAPFVLLSGYVEKTAWLET